MKMEIIILVKLWSQRDVDSSSGLDQLFCLSETQGFGSIKFVIKLKELLEV